MAFRRRYGYGNRSRYYKKKFNSTYSNENWNSTMTIANVAANSWAGTHHIEMIEPLATLGTRRIRKVKMTVYKENNWPILVGLVYLPQGMQNPSNLSHGAGATASTYEPNQHVLCTGQVTETSGIFYSSGRTLSAGDSIHFVADVFNPTNAAAGIDLFITLSYSISF